MFLQVSLYNEIRENTAIFHAAKMYAREAFFSVIIDYFFLFRFAIRKIMLLEFR